MEYFKLAKIKFEEISKEVTDFIQSVYKNSKNMFTPASPWGQIMLVIIRISQKIFYYIEDSITELFITTASRPNSIRGLSILTGHNPTRAIAASGTLSITHNGVIPQMNGNIVSIKNLIQIKNNDNGLTYTAVFPYEDLKINLFSGQKTFLFKIYQGVIEEQSFTSNGNKYQSFNVMTKYGTYIDHFMINVFVNDKKWKIKESFYDLEFQENACLVKTGIAGGIDVFFGNNFFGAVPQNGAEIKIRYLLNNGLEGNIINENDAVFEFLESGEDINGTEIDLNEIFNLQLATSVSFASDPEPLFLTKLISPNMSRSFVLANTSNYYTFFEKFQLFSYIDVFTKFDENRPWLDNIVYGLLVPDIKKRFRKGDNYFTLPLEYFKLTDIEKLKISDLIEGSERKIINSVFKFVDPIFKKYVLFIYVKTWAGYNKDNIYENIISSISEYFSNFSRKDLLPRSDIIAILEGIQGIDSVSLFFVSEDIETLIYELLNLDSNDVNMANIPDDLKFGSSPVIDRIKNEFEDYKKYKNITVLSKEDKKRIIFSYLEIREYISKFIDINGDIILQKGTLPLFRGGWKDRDGNLFSETLNKNTLSSVNITFTSDSNPLDSTNLIRNNYNKSI